MAKSAVLSQLDSRILLDAGTNELEILVLHVGDMRCGVNVAKVREVLEVDRVTRLPQSHPAVEGTVYIRGQVVELVNLQHFFDGVAVPPAPADRMLVMEFNAKLLAFRVQGVDQILRLSWTSVQPVPVVGKHQAAVTAVVLHDNQLTLMLDFERIGASVGMCREQMREEHAQIVAQQSTAPPNVLEQPIAFAEDSQMISAMLADAFAEAGFLHVRGFVDGQDAWQFLTAAAAESAGPLSDRVALLVTDVEMPRMDGLTLTRRIREHSGLKELPVVVFSSIVSKDNQKKGQQVGASAQVAKPRYSELVQTVERLLSARN